MKERKKIIVKVYQDRETGKKKLVNVWEDEKTNVLQLTAFLYRKTIQKSTNLKISYKYDYYRDSIDYHNELSEIEYYNCNNELGKYLKYYIESDII